MSHLYSIFVATVVGTSLFAMNRKDDISGATNPKNPVSCHMESELWGYHREKDMRTEHITYKYADGSKSTYTTYSDTKK